MKTLPESIINKTFLNEGYVWIKMSELLLILKYLLLRMQLAQLPSVLLSLVVRLTSRLLIVLLNLSIVLWIPVWKSCQPALSHTDLLISIKTKQKNPTLPHTHKKKHRRSNWCRKHLLKFNQMGLLSIWKITRSNE